MSLLRLTALALVALGALLLWPVAPASADGVVVIDCPTFVPPPVTPCPPNARCVGPREPGVCPAYLRVKNHNVTVTIANQVARTHIDQTFVNDSAFQLEGTYIFPLPADAAISDFAMFVDGQRLEGKVLDRNQAREIYESIVRRQRDPALLEYVGRGAFQARIFPILPGAEKRVEISYSQVLTVENGLVKYVYPLSTEKFSPGPLGSVSVNVSLQSPQAIKAIYSPSHKISVERTGDFKANIGYEDSNVKPDRDFVLYYSVSASEIGATLLTYKPDSATDGFFLLLVAPQVEVAQQNVVAKDVILVLDTSGSMSGEKIVQARGALKFVLQQLQPQDRFNVITFATSLVTYASGLRPSSERADAIRFVDGLSAGGSTDINRALLTAMADADKTRPTLVIFLTDGLPTVGETDVTRILDNVNAAAPPNVRLFNFGVGDDVNTLLLDALSEKHRGTSAYVRPGENIEETVSAFYARVSTPVLSELKVDFGGIETYDVYPYPLPDLFAGTQLVLAGRYKTPGPATVTLQGSVNDTTQKFTFADLNFKREAGDDFIAPLWATRKIGYLLAQIRLHGENQEAIDEIVALAIRYGIVTPYTSFLIEEGPDVLTQEGRKSAGGAVQQNVPQPTAAAASGADAVGKSQANQEMKDANAAPASSEGKVKHAGDKAFVMRNGVWTDTTFVPDKMTTTKIQFGTTAYFELLAQHPEWNVYASVGERVIFVVNGIAFEITPAS